VDLKRFKTVGTRAWEKAGDAVLAVALAAGSLALYVSTLAPSVATLFDDSLEFPLVVHRLAIAHPTGYPLYTLLGKLFTLVRAPGPEGTAWAVNLLSAVAGALTVSLVYLIIRQFIRRRLPALLGAGALAVSPVFWSQATIAEVYTLNSAFVALLLWLVVRWSRRPLRPVEPFSLLLNEPKEPRHIFLPGERRWPHLPLVVRQGAYGLRGLYRRLWPKIPPRRRLRLDASIYLLVAVFGLSLTHHRTILMLAPSLLLYALAVEPRVLSRAALLGPEHTRRARWLRSATRPIVMLLLAFSAPLLLYLYLPLRGTVGSLDGTYVNSWRGFWQWVLAGGYNVFLGDNPLARDLDAGFYAELFWQQFGPVGLALALVGVLRLVRRPKALLLTGLGFATCVAFGLRYRVPDVEVFFIPAFVFVAIWLGLGLDHAAGLLRPRGRTLGVRRFLALSLLLLFLAATIQPLVLALRNYPDLDRSRQWIVHDYGQYILEQPLPPNSTIVGLLGEMTLLRYFQEVGTIRPEIETIAADDEALRLNEVASALARGRDVYVTRSLPGLAETYPLSAVTGLIDVAGSREMLIRVGGPFKDLAGAPQSVDRVLAPGLELRAYGLVEHGAHWQEWARLRLWWRAPEGLQEPFKVSARLLGADGQVVAATDAEPVGFAYPTTAWRAGEVVVDAYEIPLPAGLAPGQYTPLVIVYDPATGGERGRAQLAAVYLDGSPVRPPRRALEASVDKVVHARFGDVELLGFSAPNPAVAHPPGSDLSLTLIWQARGQSSAELRLALWLEGERNVALAETAVGGAFPPRQWHEEQVVRQGISLPLPADLPAGEYQLKMRLSRDGRPVPWGRGLVPWGSDLALGRIQIHE
jgi:hypothetical protein